ncbi:MAG: alanine racemase [Rickettsiales bacterium]|jgi:alanine racemase|nr:alanine racemase [Rickettsiales bacterium]
MHATLTVNLTALRTNYCLLKNKLNGRHCGAVVKANAYGLGIEQVSKALWNEGCRQFFVATLDEGIGLRRILPDAKQIYVFHGPLHGEESTFVEHRLMPVINSPEQLVRWRNVAGQSLGAALHIDTGMTRLGFSEHELSALSREQLTTNKIHLIMSHLACANDPLHTKNAEQLARFEAMYRPLDGLAASLANSAGIFLGQDYHYDMARPGCALYGINPIDGDNPMKHVASLSAPILQIRTLERDETVGYGATYNAPKGARIAITALGYADGLMRILSNSGFAYVAGQRVPIAGRVSMDMVALDVSSISESLLYQDGRAEFINEKQTVNDIADRANTIGYEIFTRIGERVKRVYY